MLTWGTPASSRAFRSRLASGRAVALLIDGLLALGLALLALLGGDAGDHLVDVDPHPGLGWLVGVDLEVGRHVHVVVGLRHASTLGTWCVHHNSSSVAEPGLVRGLVRVLQL